MAARARTANPSGLLPVLLAFVLLGVAWGGGSTLFPEAYAKGGDTAVHKVFRGVTRAFEGEDARGVVARMAPKGRLRLVLAASNIKGTYGVRQAQSVLKAYFQKVRAVRLKDVTPARKKDEESYRVRHFEYQYVAEGKGKVRALLRVTLKKEPKQGGWSLVAAEEGPLRHRR